MCVFELLHKTFFCSLDLVWPGVQGSDADSGFLGSCGRFLLIAGQLEMFELLEDYCRICPCRWPVKNLSFALAPITSGWWDKPTTSGQCSQLYLFFTLSGHQENFNCSASQISDQKSVKLSTDVLHFCIFHQLSS